MNQKLYDTINAGEEMSDAEKRETYNAEVAKEQEEQEWQDEQN